MTATIHLHKSYPILYEYKLDMSIGVVEAIEYNPYNHFKILERCAHRAMPGLARINDANRHVIICLNSIVNRVAVPGDIFVFPTDGTFLVVSPQDFAENYEPYSLPADDTDDV